MACNHCTEFTRSHLVRQAVAEAGRGLPRDRAGDAGAGRAPGSAGARSCCARAPRCWPSTAPPSCGLGDLEEGIAQAAGRSDPVLVSIFMEGGIDSLSVLAPTNDATYRRLRPTPGAPARRRRPRSARTRACAGTRRPRRSPTSTPAGKVTRDAGGRLREPRPVALHLAPLLGGRRPDPERDQRLARAAARHDRDRRQPAAGTRRSTARSRRRWPAAGAGGGDRRARATTSGPGRLGRRREADVRRRRASSARRSAAPRTRRCARPGNAAAQAMQLRTQLQPFSGEEVTPPVAYPDGDDSWFGDSLAALAAMLAAGLPIRCVALSPPATTTPTTTRPRASTSDVKLTADTLAAFQADLEARGLADRVHHPASGRSSAAARRRTTPGTDHGAGGAAYVIGTRGARADDRRVPRASRSSTPTTTCARPPTSAAVYCSILEQWFGVDAGAVIPDAGSFARPALIG